MDKKMQIAKPRERFTKLKNLGRRPRTLIGLLLFLTLSGCNNLSGSLPAEYGAPPSSVLCDRGVPNAEGTACINAEHCSDHSECTPPYKCNLATSACEPRVACTTKEDCNQNECIDGACHNPPVCIPGRATCIPGDYCDETTKTCMGGSCSLSNCRTGICKEGECANQERCTKENETTHCQAGFVCQRVLGQEYGACVEKNQVALDCSQGGIPDFFSHTCVTPPKGTCNNEDKKCIQGFYCLEKDHTCYTSFCNDSTCNREVTGSKGGVCDHDTGECIEPDKCTTSEVCFKGAYCVEEKCQNLEEVCRATCSGKQKCAWKDVEEDGVTCQDATHCEAKEDCVGQRICTVAGKCEDPPTTACVNDGNTNNSLDTAKDLPANEDFVLCNSNDLKEDWFAVNVISGYRLEITVTLDPLDVGKGKLTIEPFVKDGVSKNRLPYKVREQSHKRNEYVIILDAMNGDTKVYVQIKADDIHSTGITYKIRARQLIDKALSFCQDSLTNKLTLNNILSSNSNPTVGEGEVKANIEGLEQVCADSSAVVDQAWTLEVKEKQMVEISAVGLDSQSKTDLVLSLRRICYDSSTELACKNEKSGVQAEKIQEVLEPGFYSVLVGAPNQAAVGKYQILAKGYPLGCEPTDNSCSGDTLKYCKDYRVLEEKACKKGCDVDAKACKEDLGRACTFAHPVQFNNENIYSANFNLSDYVSNKIISDSSCNVTTTNTLGRNVFLKASVPAGSTLTGTLDYKDGDRSPDYSLYLLQDCHASTCLATSDRPGMTASETILWKNNTDETKEVILVIDSNDLRNYTNKSIVTLNLALHSEDPCVPGTATCELGRMIKTCNPLSTGYDYTFCSPKGCTDDGDGNATCKPADGDSCTNAIDVKNETLTDQSFEFVGDVYKEQTCGDLTASNTKKDLVYKVTAGKPGDIVRFTVTANGLFDPQIWLLDQCDGATEGQCNPLYGENKTDRTDGKKEVIVFNAPQAGDYYFVVEDANGADSSSVNHSLFTVQGETKSPECTPGAYSSNCKSTTELEYCSSLGEKLTHSCESCNDAICQQTTNVGDTCFDPIILSESSGVTTKRFGNKTNHIDLPHGKTGGCVISQNDFRPTAEETIYAITLDPQELFTANVSVTNNQKRAITSYILEDCTQTVTCQALERGKGELEYYNSTNEKKTIYLVVDSSTNFYGNYTVQWKKELTTGYKCTPNTTWCDTTDSSKVYQCSSSGKKLELSCPQGWSCEQSIQACQPPKSWTTKAGDTCGTAIEMETGTILSIHPDLLVSDKRTPVCSLSQEGKDFFVKLKNVPSNSVIRAKGLSTNYEKSGIFISEDCALSSCLAKNEAASGSYKFGASLNYLTSAQKDYYVGIKMPEDAKKPFDFSIYTESKECATEGEYSCSNGNLLQCKNYSHKKVITCESGCNALNSACETKSGKVCYDAIEVSPTSTPQTLSGSFDGKLSAFTPHCNSLLFVSYEGQEVFYKITASSASELTVSAKSTGTTKQRLALYLFDSDTCDGDASACNGAYSASGTSTIKHDLRSGDTIYLIVKAKDIISDSNNAGYSITFKTN